MDAALLTRWNEESGHFLSAEHQRVAQIINDWEPTLSLVWIPPENRQVGEPFPFAILHSPVGETPYIVRRVKESEVDHRLIAWLWNSDKKNVNILDKIEKEEQAKRAIQLLEEEEASAQAKELAAFAVKAPAGARLRHKGPRLV